MNGDRGWMSLPITISKYRWSTHFQRNTSSCQVGKGDGRSDRLPALARLKSDRQMPKIFSSIPATSSSGPRPEVRSTASRSRSLIRRRSSSPRPSPRLSLPLHPRLLFNSSLVSTAFEGFSELSSGLLRASSMCWLVLP